MHLNNDIVKIGLSANVQNKNCSIGNDISVSTAKETLSLSNHFRRKTRIPNWLL